VGVSRAAKKPNQGDGECEQTWARGAGDTLSLAIFNEPADVERARGGTGAEEFWVGGLDPNDC
jgi:hypothetical protein